MLKRILPEDLSLSHLLMGHLCRAHFFFEDHFFHMTSHTFFSAALIDYSAIHSLCRKVFKMMISGNSPCWWAVTVATYCTRRMVDHPKSKSTQPRFATRWVTQYRVTLVVAYLGWVDLDLGGSTILLGQ